MNDPRSARLSYRSRVLSVDRVLSKRWTVEDAAEAAGVSVRSLYKWIRRFLENGREALLDRSSRPKTSPSALSREHVELIEKLRRQKLTAEQIARQLRISTATVARVLKRLGLSRLKALRPPEPVVRYEHKRPGSLVHLDTKKLGRFARAGHRIHGDPRTRVKGAGWEFAHVAIDDCTRLAYVEILPNERGETTAAFLLRALAWFRRLGIRVRRILTDNGPLYRAFAVANVCSSFRIRHKWTRPYRPQTNGKAERFIQTLLREWAYAREYSHSDRRAAALPAWLRHYNLRRPHGGIGRISPIARFRSAA